MIRLDYFEPLPLVKLDFYKENGNWYADVPHSSKEENIMVGHCPEFLNAVAGDKERISFYLSEENVPSTKECLVGVMLRKKHDDSGATYSINVYNKLANRVPYALTKNDLWLCNVTHLIFGDHPDTIYIFDFND